MNIDEEATMGVVCGQCGGPIYFERCTDDTGSGHEWVSASECQQCGIRFAYTCPDCGHQGIGES